MPSWIEVIKDYQVLIAASVTLAAAIIAYFSAQVVSRRQIKTTQRKDEIEALQRELALIGHVTEWSIRLTALSKVRCAKLETTLEYITQTGVQSFTEGPGNIVLAYFRDELPLSKIAPLEDTTWKDIAIVTPEVQDVYHRLLIRVIICDHAAASITAVATHMNPVTPRIPQILNQVLETYRALIKDAQSADAVFDAAMIKLRPTYQRLARKRKPFLMRWRN